MKYIPILIALFLGLLAVLHATEASTKADGSKPNIVVIFTDDQGYGDLGCFGSTTIRTPHLDRLAKEGRRFTSFMVAANVCSPSRAGLLTGCFPKRVGMHQGVLFPGSPRHRVGSPLRSAARAETG